MPIDLHRRVVEVIADTGRGVRHGSGCIIAGRVVITAAHVVEDAIEILVRTSDKDKLAATLDLRFMGAADGSAPDLALVEITDSLRDLPPMLLARLDRGGDREGRVNCHAYGYPFYAERQSSGREVVDAVGAISLLSGMTTGLLSVTVHQSPQLVLPENRSLADSPWSGMSGGPVVTDGMLLGVVTVHGTYEGPSTITAVPISAIERDPAHPQWGNGVTEPAAWWSKLGTRGLASMTAVPTGRPQVSGLPDFVPTSVRGRDGELAAVRALVAEKGTVLCELRGPAGIGKTALAAEVARDFDGRAAFLNATGYIGVTVHAVLDVLAKAVADREEREELLARHRQPDADTLTRLDDVMVALADEPVLLVVDNAEELVSPDGKLRDEGLAAVLTAIANTRGHRIRILLVTAKQVGRRSTPRFQLSPAGPVLLEGELQAPEYRAFVDDLVNARPDPISALSADELGRITGRHPRWTEILLSMRLGSDLPDAAGGRRLTEAVMAALPPEQSSVVQVLAVCGRPVGTAAVSALTGMPRDEAGEVLHKLASSRVIRRHRDLYYLPSAEVAGVTRWLGSGAVDVGRRRAASYFDGAARGQVPNSLDQCADWFNAIDLYICADEPVSALDVMEEVDRRHLREWGHSDALLPWLRDLSGRIDGSENRVRYSSLLARALAQSGRLEDGIKEAVRAVQFNFPLQDRQRNVSLFIQLAGYLFAAGRVGVAAEHYKLAAAQAQAGDRPGTAEAVEGLALCYTQTGRFDEALRHVDEARHSLTNQGDGEEAQLFGARLAYNRALIEFELGEDVRCAESVAQARDVPDDLKATPLLARCDDLDARMHLYRKQPDEALPLAAAACKAAAQIGSPELARIAGTTYAIVLLRKGRFQDALKASRSAARFKRSFFVAEALAVEGVAAFRVDETSDRARAAFVQALAFATHLREQEWDNYQAWETMAIAEVGLILMGDRTSSWQAEVAYQRAIAGSGNCRGARHRRWELFDVLTAGRPPAILSRVQALVG